MGERDRLQDAIVAGRFRLKRRLGAGSMGVVYEGTNLLLGARVAIKLLHVKDDEHPELAARFRREAKAAAAAESDYIVKIIDAGHDPEFGLFMVTEFLVGEDLEVCLHRERRLDPSEAVGIAYQVARGLSKAHRAGVVHRDLKPANIFLAEGEEGGVVPKILDFGVSSSGSTTGSASRRTSPRQGWRSGHRSSCRRSRCAASTTSTRAPTCGRSRRCSTRCSPGA